MHNIESEIEKLEWKIQTTSLSVNEEKLLIDQVRVLETQLSFHKQMQELGNALFELQTEEKALETRANLHHEKLSELAEQSQSFHEKITEILSKVDVLRVEADAKHQKYVEFKQQAQTVHQEQTGLLRQIKSLREELRQMEEKKQAKRQRELRKDLMEKASEKLKQGEKLTWEEFKILAEKKKVESLKTRKK
jgi:phosphoserine phosphatase